MKFLAILTVLSIATVSYAAGNCYSHPTRLVVEGIPVPTLSWTGDLDAATINVTLYDAASSDTIFVESFEPVQYADPGWNIYVHAIPFFYAQRLDCGMWQRPNLVVFNCNQVQ